MLATSELFKVKDSRISSLSNGEQPKYDSSLMSSSLLISVTATSSAIEAPGANQRQNGQGVTQEQRLPASRASLARDAQRERKILIDEMKQAIMELEKENEAMQKECDELRDQKKQLKGENEKIRRRQYLRGR